MKKIKFTCPNCESTLRVPMHLAGVSGPCPKCGNTITAPSEPDEATDISSSSRSSVASREVHSPRISRQLHATAAPSHGNGVATLPPPVAAERSASRSQVNIARDVLSPDPMAEQEMREAASARLRAPLPDVAVAPPQYEEPPPPIFPPREEQISEPSVSDYSNGHSHSEIGDEVPPALKETPAGETDPVTEAIQRPMVVPKTQPIRVKKNSTALPPRRNETEDRSSGELPRLDVSLANGGSASASSALIHDGTDPNRGRTRIQLPQLGEESAATRPEDFAQTTPIPEAEEAAPPEPVVVPPPMEEAPALSVNAPEPPVELEPRIEPTPPPVPEDFSPPPSLESIPPMEEVVEEVPPALEEVPLSYEEPTPGVKSSRITEAIPLSPLPMEALTEIEPDLPAVEELAVPVTAPADAQPPIAPEQELPAAPAEMPPSSPSEPVVEAQIPAPVYHSLTNQEELPAPRKEVPAKQESESKEDYEDEGTAGGSIGKLINSGVPQESPVLEQPRQLQTELPEAASSSPVAAPTHSPEPLASPPAETKAQRPADDWESLLGDGEDESKPGRTAIVMLSVIGAVAIVTVIVVVLVGQALGGFSADRNTMAGMQKPEQKPPSKPKVVAPEKTETDDSGEPVVPDKIDIPGKEEETVGTVTLPFNYDNSVRLSDPNKVASQTDASESSVVENRAATTPPVGNGGNSTVSNLDGKADATPDQFQEKVQNILNGGATEVGQSPAPASTTTDVAPAPQESTLVAGNPAPGPQISFPDSARPEPAAAAPAPAPKPPAPDSFLAPTGDESRIARTREVIEAFLDAPTWQERTKYVYQGESIRPALEEYYKKWPDTKVERYSLQFEQIDETSETGNPYWMYFMSTSDNEEGIPIIVRVEDGNLKVDWEIYSEFQDRHFAKFLDGGIASPHTFRVVCEEKTGYYGSDREGFTDLSDYLVYEIFPPYGDIGEYSTSAFVKKGSPVAQKLGADLGLGDDALAVIVTLDWVSFPHGIKHLVIKDYLTEGWFK